MVIKDFECGRCGSVVRDQMVESDCRCTELACHKCYDITWHNSLISNAHSYRMGEELLSHLEFAGPREVAKRIHVGQGDVFIGDTGKSCTDGRGGLLRNRPEFSEGAISERREKAIWQREADRGRRPIVTVGATKKGKDGNK